MLLYFEFIDSEIPTLSFIPVFTESMNSQTKYSRLLTHNHSDESNAILIMELQSECKMRAQTGRMRLKRVFLRSEATVSKIKLLNIEIRILQSFQVT